jgi:hypothetical protein
MTSPCALTTLRTSTPGGATKSFIRARDGAMSKTSYAKVAFWNISTIAVASFDDLARELAGLVEDQAATVVRGAPKAGLDLSRPQRRKTTGDSATLDDVPRRWLHLDLDNVSAPHVDVIDDPSGAIDYALDLVAAHAPELEGASCFAAFSSSAGVFDPTAAKLHLWYWLDRPYSGAELKRWASRVNEGAGSKLIDPQLFVAAQPNYTARPVFVGMPDPLPGRRRWTIRRGFADQATLEIPAQAATRSARRAPTTGRAATSPSSCRASTAKGCMDSATPRCARCLRGSALSAPQRASESERTSSAPSRMRCAPHGEAGEAKRRSRNTSRGSTISSTG